MTNHSDAFRNEREITNGHILLVPSTWSFVISSLSFEQGDDRDE